MSIEVEFQRSLFAALNTAKATLGVTGVYDIAPQPSDAGSASNYPMIVMGRILANQADTQTTVGFELTCRIHTWSVTGSMLECKTIQGKIFDILHRQTLAVTGARNFVILRNDTDCLHEQDGTVHGVCEYRALVEEA